jgi:S1-C subfamily serine protease
MEGTSFAIPIDRVREILQPLKEGRAVHHGYLGISLATCTPAWARQSNLRLPNDASSFPEVHGAVVHKVFPRTPAERGGVRENDVIVEIDGKPIRSSDDARRFIDTADVGKVRPEGVLTWLCMYDRKPPYLSIISSLRRTRRT